MESNKGISKQNFSEVIRDELLFRDNIAALKKVTDIDNYVNCEYEDLIISSAKEEHIREVAELWANLASVQQIFAPHRYNFKAEGKDWQLFVKKKLSKKNNLLLVTHANNDTEIRGFLYLQTVTLPSSDLVLKGIIEDIYTKPQYRQQKTASNLLEASLNWALRQKVKHVDLIALTRTKDLLEFYLSFINQFKKNIDLKLLII